MVKFFRYSWLGALFLLGLVGCTQSPLGQERGQDEGALTTKLRTPAGASKAEPVVLDVPPVESFEVIVRSAANPEPVYTSLYADFPYSLNLIEGDYTIEAAYGQKLPFVTENPCYFIQQRFQIERGSATSVELTARLVGFGVEGVFDPDMSDYFASWQLEAEINDVWDQAYTWAVDGQQPLRAYFLPPAQVRVILRGVRHDGSKFSQVIKEITSAGSELYTLKIHVLPPGHSLAVSVSTERSVVTDKGVVSIDALPDLESPTMGTMTFYETTTVPAEGTAATVELHSFVGFSDVEVTIPKEGYELAARAYRWSDPTDRVALRAAGVDLGSDDLSAVRTATLNAKGLVNTMLADAAVEREYDMQVQVTDGTGKTSRTTLPIRIERPEFTLPAIEAGACWAKRIYVPNVAVVEGKGDAALMEQHAEFSYQISSDGGVTWNDFSRTELAAVGLTPNTTYQFRTRFRDWIGPAVLAKTEAVTQIPNGAMDDWSVDMWTTGTGTDMPRYRAWLSGETDRWWATNNDRTVQYAGPKNAYNCFPAVSYTKNGRSGKAAELRTISASGSGINSSINEEDAHRTPGRLFLGTYTAKGGDAESIIRGKSFGSRPSKMVFYFQYEPWGSDARNGGDDEFCGYVELYNGTTQIGRGEFKYKTTGRTSVTSWTKAEVDIVYSNNALKADQIVIDFVSTTDPSPKVSTHWERLGSQHKSGESGNDYGNGCPTLADFSYGKKMWQYYGSVLQLDDIELIYE